MFCFQGVEQDAKNRIKNIIPSGSYGFFKYGSQYNYYMCANFKSRYLKTTLGTFFEKTIQARGLKLCSYVPLMRFYKLISGIFEFFFDCFGRKWALRCAKISFLQISQKVKVLELNVVFSTNKNIHITVILSFV